MPKGVRGIVYDELDNVFKNRPMALPASNLEQSVIYSNINELNEPNKVSDVMMHQCYYSYHSLLCH